jgi:hypothetical protein
MRAFALLALAGAALLATAGMASGQLADVLSIISPRMFDDMLSNRSQRGCEGGAFYTYDALWRPRTRASSVASASSASL